MADVDDISWDAPGKTENKIHEYVTQIMDMNHMALSLLRERASDFTLLAGAFRQMAEWCDETATECQIKARQVADLSGGMISAEFQLVPVDDDDDDDDDDDGEEEDEEGEDG